MRFSCVSRVCRTYGDGDNKVGKLSGCCRVADAAALGFGVALRLVLDGDLAEEQTAGFAARTEADPENESHEFADLGEVDGESAQQRSVVPDVAEGEAGELAAPAQSQRDSTQTRQRLVAAVECSREARVATSPHTVD